MNKVQTSIALMANVITIILGSSAAYYILKNFKIISFMDNGTVEIPFIQEHQFVIKMIVIFTCLIGLLLSFFFFKSFLRYGEVSIYAPWVLLVGALSLIAELVYQLTLPMSYFWIFTILVSIYILLKIITRVIKFIYLYF